MTRRFVIPVLPHLRPMRMLLPLLASIVLGTAQGQADGIGAGGKAAPGASRFLLGADLSLLQHLEDRGVRYKEAGQAKDALRLFKDHGCNCVRLRLFVSPDGTRGQVNTLGYTLKLARRVKQAGLQLMLDLHYSDHWADPAHQRIPDEWKDLAHAQLVERVSAYTRDTLGAFEREGCLPDIVAVGNEITNGFLWPDGGPLKDEARWGAMADLLKAGLGGARAGAGGRALRTMVHIDKGGDRQVCGWFFDQLQRRGVDFDLIGLSYYPFWHGTLADLRANLAALADTFRKDIVVVETGYDAAGGPQADLPFPPTPAGQKAFLEELIRVVVATPGGRGRGVVYWAPEWIPAKEADGAAAPGPWAGRALFDEAGNMRPALDAFRGAAGSGTY